MSVGTQHPGVTKRSPTGDQHSLQSQMGADSQRGGQPSDEQLRISYGFIEEVNAQNNQVKVRLFGRNDRGDDDELLSGGAFFPILQPLHVIHLLYGSLRKGLCVRIFWRGGKGKPGRESIIEVVSDADCAIFRSGKKVNESNEIATGNFLIFQGGTSG